MAVCSNRLQFQHLILLLCAGLSHHPCHSGEARANAFPRDQSISALSSNQLHVCVFLWSYPFGLTFPNSGTLTSVGQITYLLTHLPTLHRHHLTSRGNSGTLVFPRACTCLSSKIVSNYYNHSQKHPSLPVITGSVPVLLVQPSPTAVQSFT